MNKKILIMLVLLLASAMTGCVTEEEPEEPECEVPIVPNGGQVPPFLSIVDFLPNNQACDCDNENISITCRVIQDYELNENTTVFHMYKIEEDINISEILMNKKPFSQRSCEANSIEEFVDKCLTE